MVNREGKLRDDFLKALKNNPQGDVVDDLINILKRDYVLLVKEPLSCRDCANYQVSNGWISPNYCRYYQRKIFNCDEADLCERYFSGNLEARKSLARIHCSDCDDLFY